MTWLHEARSPEGALFRIGHEGGKRIAEWEGLLRLEVGRDGVATIDAASDSLGAAKLRDGAVPALLGHLNGHLHWHAAACVWPGESAVLVLGDAGAGKSTLVAGLCNEAGASFLADDVAAITRGRTWQVQRREKNHAMRPDMAAALFGHNARMKAVFAAERLRSRARLGLVVVVQLGAALAVQTLPARQKVHLLTRNLVRFALDDEARLARDLDVVLRLASEVPMVALVRPPVFSAWPELAALLRARLRGVVGSE